jgi:hypothetical protein
LRSGPQPTAVETDLTAPNPDDDKYEFGEADPQYLADLTEYKVELKLTAREKAQQEKAQTEVAERERQATLQHLDTNWAERSAKGAEKYDDFNATVEDFKTNAPCPPLMAVAIQSSPVAEDVTYYLGKNKHEAEALAAQVMTGDTSAMMAAAERFGAIEGQFLDEMPTRPTGNHPLDMAAYAGPRPCLRREAAESRCSTVRRNQCSRASDAARARRWWPV